MRARLAVGAALCTLAAWAGTAFAHPAPAGHAVVCGTAGARTLAGDAEARVYVAGHTVFGCARHRASQALGSTGPCPGRPEVGTVALAGTEAAFTLRTCGVDTFSVQVVVRSLQTGRRAGTWGAVSGVIQVEAIQSVGSIVVRSDGDAAWIGSSSSLGNHQTATQVIAEIRGRESVLDSGRSITAGSLRLTGSSLSWTDAGVRRTAKLV
jgi:hypothetical protein